MCAAGVMQKEIGERFGIASSAVSAINRGKRRADVAGPLNPKAHFKKVSDEDLVVLRTLVASGSPIRDVAEKFGITSRHALSLAKNEVRPAA